jgi:multidrug efflux pump
VPEVWQEVSNSIGDIRHTLPQGVLGPFFNDNFGDVFGIIYGFTADGFSDRELRDYVDVVRATLWPRSTGSARSSSSACRTRQVLIEFQPDRVAAMGLTTARSSRPSPRRTWCAPRA